MTPADQRSLFVEARNKEVATTLENLRALFAPAIPTEVLVAYWEFAFERQEIFFKRINQAPPPWTDDPILNRHKFTNAYRASDRVSQFLIRHVIYGPQYSDQMSSDDIIFRTLLFKLFNRIDTWTSLEGALGALRQSSFSYGAYDAVLSDLLERGHRLYSAAYIIPAAPRPAGERRKHRSHLLLLERMLGRDDLVSAIVQATTMQDVFNHLRAFPSIGPFLAYQFATDINYGPVTSFSEMDFVVPGPGALDGISKCFYSLAGLSEIEIIRLMAEVQEQAFLATGLPFRNLWGRRLQLIDCQNLFCEVGKYARVSHPQFAGVQARTRIKQQFRSAGCLEPPWYPPKWGLNERIALEYSLSGKLRTSERKQGRPIDER